MPVPAAESPIIWFVGGPPLGPGVFADVQSRLGRGELVAVLDPERPRDGWRERGDALALRIRAAGRPVVLVAHGLGVPAAIAAAPATAGLVLLNGPITRLDPVTAAFARLARLAPAAVAGSLLQRGVLVPWLASSAGLRRVVANPYVMDRDTVAALAVSTVESAEARAASASYLASLAAGLPEVGRMAVPMAVLWGDEDLLYPCSEADFVCVRAGLEPYRRLAGGRFLGVVERPWEVAEELVLFLSKCFPGAQTATPMSQSAAGRPPKKRKAG